MDDKRGTRHFSERVRGSYVQGRWEIRPIWRQSVFFSIPRPTHYTLHDRDQRSTFSSPRKYESTVTVQISGFYELEGEGRRPFTIPSIPHNLPLLPSRPRTLVKITLCIKHEGIFLRKLDNRTFMDLRWGNETTILENISWLYRAENSSVLDSFFFFWEEFLKLLRLYSSTLSLLIASRWYSWKRT